MILKFKRFTKGTSIKICVYSIWLLNEEYSKGVRNEEKNNNYTITIILYAKNF